MDRVVGMIDFAEYRKHDAVGLAELVRRGDVSASELLEAALARDAEVNPRLNAVVIPMHEIGRRRALETLSGPFAGVPFLVKDLAQDVAGVMATSGSNALRRTQYVPSVSSEIVRRWLAAGVVVFGRTNTPEFGAKGITEPEAWGPTKNPWDLTRSPGGSSGGSAAAVAAGIVPMAGASDGGGSIRIPAASTGLFGLKPGRGRTPCGPGLGEMLHGAAMNHVLTRSVRDSAHMLDATMGPEVGGAVRIAPPERPYRDEVGRDPGRLRIAFSGRSPIDAEVDPSVTEALNDAARLLESLGHHVEQAEPDIDGAQLARDFLSIWFANLAAYLDQAKRDLGATDLDFELDSLAMAAVGHAMSAPAYVEAYLRWNQYGYALAQFFARRDVYMTPTLALGPPKIGALATPAWARTGVRAGVRFGMNRLIPLAAGTIERLAFENLKGVPFTQLANLTGVPAMSVPLATFPDGLPLGIQFLADHGGEGRLLSLAAQLERTAPWAARVPRLDG